MTKTQDVLEAIDNRIRAIQLDTTDRRVRKSLRKNFELSLLMALTDTITAAQAVHDINAGAEEER